METNEKSKEKINNDLDYDPHKHRNNAHATTNMETLIHLLKCSLGTGILAMPNAFRNSGWVTGTIGTIFIGSLCTYCLHIFVRAQYELCKRMKVPVLNYTQCIKAALEHGPPCLRGFANCAAMIVNAFLVIYQLGICCVYVVFISSNIKQVADQYTEPRDIQYYMIFLLLPLILINYIRNLKLLAPFSNIANIITFTGLGIVLVFIFQDLPDLNEREMFGTFRNFALFMGTTLFALEAVGVIIALENNMATPQHFRGSCGVLNKGMTVIISMYTFVGLFGYIKYGPETTGSITLNLPKDAVMAQSVKIMFAVAILISYALQAYVPVEILWYTYLQHHFKKNKLFWEYVCRTVLVLITFILAIEVPRLGLFISLFGALCLSALGISFPSIVDICVLWPDKYGPFKYILIKDIGLIIFGFTGLCAGTYVSIIDIIESFK